MKLIIEIPDKMYKTVQDGTYCGSLYEKLKNGIPVEQCVECIKRQDVEDAIYDYSRSCDVNYAQIMEFIDKLPSVTPQPCDDAVSRQAVLDEIDKRFDLAKPFKQLIKSMPPVTPQQKMGRWAVLKDEYGDVIEDVCSNCDKNGNRKWAFCPFCGCKMQEVEND